MRDPEAQAQRWSAAIADLARPGDVRALRLPLLHVVMSLRLCALFERAEREPLAELSTRFASFTAARAVLDLARTIRAVWPEAYVCARPCCMKMTPDEATLAALGRAALSGDRAAFTRQIDGFIRSDRHERLHGAMLAALTSLPRQG